MSSLAAVSAPFVSYAQNGEDIVIWRVFNDLRHAGFYVDVGAADPVGYSATYALYLRGWNGINIEPEPRFADALRNVRPRDITVQKAAGSTCDRIQFHVAAGTGLSTGRSDGAEERLHRLGFDTEVIDIEVDTLDSILEQHLLPGTEVHVLKIDVEGMEADVLEGTSLSRWSPWLCVIEATEQLSPKQNHQLWERHLLDVGYSFELFDGLNRYYLSPDHEALRDRLASGPCVFDQPFQRADVSLTMERHRSSTESQLAETMREIERLSARCAELAEQRNVAVTEATDTAGRFEDLNNQLHQDREEIDRLHRAVLAQRDHFQALLADLHIQLESERRRATHLQNTLEVMSTSKSWRLTKPLRWVRSGGKPEQPATFPDAVDRPG
jgi:FkbM family methyltransferase